MVRRLFIPAALVFGFLSAPAATFAIGETITVTQVSESYDTGEWVLEKSNGSELRGSFDEFKASTTGPGDYSITVTPPSGAKTFISVTVGSNDLGTVETLTRDFALESGDSATVTITYRYKGIVTVVTKPNGVAFYMTSTLNEVYEGTSKATFTDMPPSRYTINLPAVPGCEIPRPISRSLNSNGTLDFIYDYNCDAIPQNDRIQSGNPRPVRGELPKTVTLTDPPKTMDTTTDDTVTEPNEITPPENTVRIVQSVSTKEAVPGQKIQATIVVVNTSDEALKNVIVRQSYDPELVRVIPRDGGKYVSAVDTLSVVQWTVPNIAAGSTWRTTVDVVLDDNFPQGQKTLLTTNVSGNKVDADTFEKLVSSVEFGVPALPQTGFGIEFIALLLAGLFALAASITMKLQQVAIQQKK